MAFIHDPFCARLSKTYKLMINFVRGLPSPFILIHRAVDLNKFAPVHSVLAQYHIMFGLHDVCPVPFARGVSMRGVATSTIPWSISIILKFALYIRLVDGAPS